MSTTRTNPHAAGQNTKLLVSAAALATIVGGWAGLSTQTPAAATASTLVAAPAATGLREVTASTAYRAVRLPVAVTRSSQ